MGQGDTISGRVSRGEVAHAVGAALKSPYAAGKTFELRRDEVRDSVCVLVIRHYLLVLCRHASTRAS